MSTEGACWLLEVWDGRYVIRWLTILTIPIIKALSRDLIRVYVAIKFIITHIIIFRKWNIQHG